MATFILKIKRDETQREGDTITIGSRASCSFSLSDPLIAEEHCLVLAHGGGFIIEDLGTSLGTYVDGVAVKGRTPLTDGAVLVLGVTRLVIKLDEEAGNITFDHKGAFYYDDKADALDWSRKEVAFGQFLPVRRGGWFMVYAMIVLAPFCYLIPATSEPLLDPGTTFHSGIPAYHAMLQDLPEGDRDCNACHEPLNGAPSTKCLACHEQDVDTGHHPNDGSLLADEDSCRTCHIDHRGLKENALIHVTATDACGRCHGPGEDISSKRAVRAIPDAHVDVRLGYETFSHAEHHGQQIEPGRTIQCQDCHRPYESGATLAARTPDDGRGRARDFVPLDYEACLKCHGDDGPALVMEPAWHGAESDGEHCLACHGEVNDEALSPVPAFTAAGDRGFAFASRSHATLVAAFDGRTDACTDCHKNEELLEGGEAHASRIFEHVTHVIDPAPAGGDCSRLSGGGRGQCAYCHEEVVRSKSLVTGAGDRHPLFGEKSCAQCHGDAQMTRPEPFTPSGTRADFPHSLHLEVAGGCYACHEFPGGDGGYPALPVTKDGAKDCTECHRVHANVGMTDGLAAHEKTEAGSCALCHRAGDPVYAGGTVTWKRWTDASFRHASRGHRDLVDGMGCVDCHGEDTWEATTVSGVPIPNEQDTMCLKCHVDDKTRFHWR